MIEVSVFILSWNNIDTIAECIDVCRDDMILNGVDHEIIVVDNGSNDGTEKFATIANKENLGISKGKNQGIDACKGKYVIMIDGDIIPVENSLILLLRYMRDHEEIDALGFYPNKWSNQRNRNGQKHHETYCNVLFDIKPINKACIYYGIFKRQLFVEGLRFDENDVFGVCGYGWEDHDFFEEMKKRGIVQYVAHINNPSGKYYHNINSSIRAMGRNKYLELAKPRQEYFDRKWQSTST